MDEDYARLLRDWLRADPGTPRPRPDFDDVVIPAPRSSSENRRPRNPKSRTAAEDGPEPKPGTRGEAEDQGDPGPDPVGRSEAQGRTATEAAGGLGKPEGRGEAEARSAADDRGGLGPDRASPGKAEGRAGLVRPLDSDSRSEVEARSAAEDPSGPGWEPDSRGEAEGRSDLGLPREAGSRSAAEERSRWNHPSNWHRRKAARAEISDRVAEPEEPRWPLHDPDNQADEPSRWSRLDEQDPWSELDDAVERSRRQELEAARERCRRNHPSNWTKDDNNNDNRSR